jgi:hypothetical protein
VLLPNKRERKKEKLVSYVYNAMLLAFGKRTFGRPKAYTNKRMLHATIQSTNSPFHPNTMPLPHHHSRQRGERNYQTNNVSVLMTRHRLFSTLAVVIILDSCCSLARFLDRFDSFPFTCLSFIYVHINIYFIHYL